MRSVSVMRPALQSSWLIHVEAETENLCVEVDRCDRSCRFTGGDNTLLQLQAELGSNACVFRTPYQVQRLGWISRD